MILGEHIVTATDRKFRIYPIGDLHINLRTHQDTRLRNYISMVKDDPAGVVFLMGDVSDSRAKNHKFFDPEMIHSRYRVEDVDIMEDLILEELEDTLAPIANKIAGVLRGNHHLAGFTRRLCRYLQKHHGSEAVDYGNRGMVRVKLYNPDRMGHAELSYVVFLTHVDSGSSLPGAQFNRQIRRSMSWDADLYLSAHSHRSSAFKNPRFGLPSRGALALERRESVHINAGAFLEPYASGYDSYADAKDLPVTSDTLYYAEVRRLRLGYKTIVKEWDG
jgi:hypothetical protein